ncbi:hypothetical protein OTU49_010092, partial [Cherax quadricarinatus]
SRRRRSELPPHEKRRRSRTDGDLLGDPSAMNGIRRGTRGSQVLNPYDLESARLSVSSNRTRKGSHRSQPEEMDPEERRRSRVVLVCASVAVAIFLIAILLVAVTLRMSPAIDEIVRKENEDILRELQAASSGVHGSNTTVPPSDPSSQPHRT